MVALGRGECLLMIKGLVHMYRGSLLMRNRLPLGPYSSTMPRALWEPYGGLRFRPVHVHEVLVHMDRTREERSAMTEGAPKFPGMHAALQRYLAHRTPPPPLRAPYRKALARHSPHMFLGRDGFL